MSTSVTFDPNLVRQAPVYLRRLGNVFAPPRNLYMLYLPLCMLAVGLACWIAPTDFMLITGSICLALICFYLLLDIILWDAPLRVSTLLVMVLGLGYGGGTANSWISIPREGLSLGEFFHKDPVGLTHTMGSILVALSVALALGEMTEKPIFGEDFEIRLPPQGVFFISMGVVIIFLAYALGALNFMGVSGGSGGTQAIFPAFAGWLIGTLFAVTLVAALNVENRQTKRYLMFLTAVQFVLEIPVGRRSLVFTTVLAIITLRLGRYRFRWSWLKRIVVIAGLGGLLYIASIGFFYMRLAGFSKTGLTIIERVTLAISYFETTNYAEVTQQFSENVQSRTFILGFLADLDALTTRYSPAYGKDLKGQFISAIPSIIYPYKDFVGEEALSNDLYGTTYWDEANSLLTGGAMDFGILGMIFYPLLITFVLRSFFEFCARIFPTFVVTLVIIAAIGALLQPEAAMTDYFLIIRNGLLFGSIVWFLIAFPAFRLRRID